MTTSGAVVIGLSIRHGGREKEQMNPKFNPTAGIPKTSYGPRDSPSFDNATWFSTVQPPMIDFQPERVEEKVEKNGILRQRLYAELAVAAHQCLFGTDIAMDDSLARVKELREQLNEAINLVMNGLD